MEKELQSNKLVDDVIKDSLNIMMKKYDEVLQENQSLIKQNTSLKTRLESAEGHAAIKARREVPAGELARLLHQTEKELAKSRAIALELERRLASANQFAETVCAAVDEARK